MENLLSRIVQTVFQECYQLQENKGRVSSNNSVCRTCVLLCVTVTRSVVSSIVKDCSAFTFERKEVFGRLTLRTEGRIAIETSRSHLSDSTASHASVCSS